MVKISRYSFAVSTTLIRVHGVLHAKVSGRLLFWTMMFECNNDVDDNDNDGGSIDGTVRRQMR